MTPQPSFSEPVTLQDQTETVTVPFTQVEQQAFLDFHLYLDSNPRRLKRLVNIYRLVRTLMTARNGSLSDNPVQVLAWLILCEQWPYAAHVMMDILDQNLKRTAQKPAIQKELLARPLSELFEAAQVRIGREKNEALKKLDLKYERLETLMTGPLANCHLADIERLRPFTVNFNPALSAEVRLTLAKGNE
jgi:hypothetical protein